MPNLVSRVVTRGFLELQKAVGVSVITARTRDEILHTAPSLARFFPLHQRIGEPVGRLPDGAAAYLSYDNPVLVDYRRRYVGHPAANHVQWDSTAVERSIDIRMFRSDNLYIHQSRRCSPLDFYARAAYTKITDRLNLWSQCEEDDLFGAEIFDFHGKDVSRDLLDSILEINFLERYANLLSSGRRSRILDIGAGYGRLAHRLGRLIPEGARYFCVDAVPESTFISRFYLDYRRVGSHVEVVPLDMMDTMLPSKLDLAINVHSFPECRYSVIEWWLQKIRDLDVELLFIVVATGSGLSSNEGSGVRRDVQPLIEQMGYRLIRRDNMFSESGMLMSHGAYPSIYYLFRRER